MNLKLIKKTGAVIAMAVVLAAAALGTGYAAPVQKNTASVTPNQVPLSLCTFSWVQSNDDGTVSNHDGYSPVDPGGNTGNDPQAAQSPGTVCARSAVNTAATTAVTTANTITFHLSNAYPGYHPTIFFGLNNQWATPGVVSSITFINPNPSLLTMTLHGITNNQAVNAGSELVGALDIAVGNIPQSGSPSYSLSVTIVVTQSGPALSINPVSLPDGQLGITYNQTLSAANGNPPYNWSVVSGALPAGLSLDAATGTISGTPNAAGTFNFTVSVTDSSGSSVSISLSITIPSPALPPATTTTAAPVIATVVVIEPAATTTTTTPVVTLSARITTTGTPTASFVTTTATTGATTTSPATTAASTKWLTSNWWWLVIIILLLAGLGLIPAFILFRTRRKKLLDFMIKRLTEGATRQQLFESEVRPFIQANHLPSYSDRDIETMLDWAIKNYPKH